MDKLEELGVELVKVDMTGKEAVYNTDLARADRKSIPVNLVYPADYPKRPAILLEEIISPGQALEALEKIASPVEENVADRKSSSDTKVVAGK